MGDPLDPGRFSPPAGGAINQAAAIGFEQLTATVPGVTVLDGTAEAIPLADASVDAVVVAQAFHWFDASAALAEIHRVVRAPGPTGGPARLALVWNARDEEVDWVRRFGEILVATAAALVKTHPQLAGRESFAFPYVTHVFWCDRL